MQLHARVQGHGPAVVLLHGLFGSHDNLGLLARRLSDDHALYALDLRNHGRSPHAEPMEYAAMATDVAETMDAHELKAAAIVGHSMGGKAGMELALAQPQRVSALVVLDIAPVAYGRHHDRELAAMQRLDPARCASRSEADAALAEAIPNAFVRQFLLKNLVRDGSAFAWRIPLATIERQYPAIAAAPSAGRYDGPVLFLRGERSEYVGDDHEAAIHERFPHARIETIPDAAHWLHAEAPEQVGARVRRFLAEATPGKS